MQQKHLEQRRKSFLDSPVLIAVLLGYILLHAATLSRFPLVHSDEAWLAGLTRTMLTEHSLSATESFFVLFPRFPHALRLLYHIVQMPFISLGYTVFMTRLPSLLAGLGVLIFVWRVSGSLVPRTAYIPLLFLAADVQFWYAAHFGRQEIFMLLFLAAGLWTATGGGARRGAFASAALTGLIVALAAGFHPNAFIVALGLGGLYAGRAVSPGRGYSRRVALAATGIVTGVTLLGAAVWLGLSLAMDPGFLHHYAELGAGQGVSAGLVQKVLYLPQFFVKLWKGVSGTYYMPEIRLQLTLFAASSAISLLLLGRKELRPRLVPLQGLAVGVAAGILLIGKYSPPSAILLFFPGYLLLALVMEQTVMRHTAGWIATVLIIVLLGTVTAGAVVSAYKADYSGFTGNLRKAVPEEGRILGNLNMAYAFDEGRLRDYRDLGLLHGAGLDINTYMDNENVRTIILTDELKIINTQRPVWNRMYGNPYYWYGDLTELVSSRGELIASFSAPWYGTRLYHLMGKKEYRVRVYRLRPAGGGNP